MIQATLFDMDGLLFDTEELGVTACKQLGRERGYAITRDMVLKTLGANMRWSNEFYGNLFPGFNGEEFWQAFRVFMREYAEKNGTPLKPYAKEIIAKLKEAGIKVALVSSSPEVTISHYLTRANMLDAFPVIISGGMGLPSKPAPDVFLRAAELLGVQPANCAVLEDSPNGLAAGRAAGMYTVMVPDLIPADDPRVNGNRDAVCPTLREACELLLARA